MNIYYYFVDGIYYFINTWVKTKKIEVNMKRLFTVFLLLSLTGCATVFSGSEQTINVKTQPNDAQVKLYSEDGALLYECVTPCKIKMKKEKLVRGNIAIEKPGYTRVEIPLGSTMEPWGVANACCLVPGIVIGGGIDLFTGNLIKADKDDIDIILQEKVALYKEAPGKYIIESRENNEIVSYVLEMKEDNNGLSISIKKI